MSGNASSDQEAAEKANKLFKGIKMAMMTTISGNKAVSRPMQIQERWDKDDQELNTAVNFDNQ
ncbi:hypothetical protein [Planomicrobium sp. CPCC 101110]|uniref:hypothetical protein n=1 Tax=Planomicrobium sp. CPCC 101110 TaxID=2599619 RepID=UPI0011B6AAB3|nr:hypothetical protein [Planomicrobium sp. CPCC 101110]TWT25239.1 hypothetical protein FQV30_12790 [Planomicrobium sp. CPCC 101110]